MFGLNWTEAISFLDQGYYKYKNFQIYQIFLLERFYLYMYL